MNEYAKRIAKWMIESFGQDKETDFDIFVQTCSVAWNEQTDEKWHTENYMRFVLLVYGFYERKGGKVSMPSEMKD